jgi:hypothetical protein
MSDNTNGPKISPNWYERFKSEVHDVNTWKQEFLNEFDRDRVSMPLDWSRTTSDNSRYERLEWISGTKLNMEMTIQPKPFLTLGNPCILVYPNMAKIDATLYGISPNSEEVFFEKKEYFEIKLYDISSNNFNKIWDGFFLFCKKDDILIPFKDGWQRSHSLDYVSFTFKPCPPEEAEKVLYASGILKKEIEEDYIVTMRKALTGRE